MDSPGYDPARVDRAGRLRLADRLLHDRARMGLRLEARADDQARHQFRAPTRRMEEDMDINCGDIVDGDATIESKGEEIFEKILAVASGEHSKSEMLGLGDNEFVPWQIGAVDVGRRGSGRGDEDVAMREKLWPMSGKRCTSAISAAGSNNRRRCCARADLPSSIWPT